MVVSEKRMKTVMTTVQMMKSMNHWYVMPFMPYKAPLSVCANLILC